MNAAKLIATIATNRPVLRVYIGGVQHMLVPNRPLRRNPEAAEAALREALGREPRRKELNRLRLLLKK